MLHSVFIKVQVKFDRNVSNADRINQYEAKYIINNVSAKSKIQQSKLKDKSHY